jgi:hypothetical protein
MPKDELYFWCWIERPARSAERIAFAYPLQATSLAANAFIKASAS